MHASGSGRYDIHEVLRQYAAEKLGEIPGEEDKVHDRLSEYYTEFLHQRKRDMKGSKQKEALKQIGEEIENVCLAWRWAVKHGRDVEVAKSVESLYFYYDTRGWFREGEEALRQAVEKMDGTPEEPGREQSSELGEHAEARQLLEECLEVVEEVLALDSRIKDL